MRDVYVAGIGMTPFAKQPSRSLKDLTAEAVRLAFADANISPSDVGLCFFGNAVAGSITGQEMVAGQVTLRPLGLEGIPIINVENACASGSTALHVACQAVEAGQAEIALAVAAEKMTHPDKSRSFAAIGGSIDVEAVPPDLPTDRSFLMDMYAQAAIEYMENTGATVEDFAAVVVKNQLHGMHNPLAQYGAELSIGEVLASRTIVWPFTLLMCSPITDGAAAVLVRGRERARAERVRVAASTLRSARGDTKVTELAAQAAYEEAGIAPGEIACAEVHEAAASAELAMYEQLGFAAPGDGAALIREGITTLGGLLPVNPSGGLLARGHPIGATGLAQVCEAVSQIRGTSGPRQVEGAQVALTQNAGGWHQGDNLVSCIHIFVSAE